METLRPPQSIDAGPFRKPDPFVRQDASAYSLSRGIIEAGDESGGGDVGAKGQDLSLAKNKVLEKIFMHLSFQPLPKGRHEVAPGGLGLAGYDSHGAINLEDRKSGELHEESSGASGRGRCSGGEGSGHL
jgi:hypothetical protein